MRNGLSLRVLFIVCLLASSVSSAYGFFDNKFEKEVEKEKSAVKLVREVQRGKYDLVTASELKEWIDQGKEMILIDTMPYKESYAKAHIPKAQQFLFPIPEMTDWKVAETDGKTVNDFKILLGDDTSKTIVIYCGFVKCTRSHNGAMWAKKLGYNKVYRFSGGLFAWKGSGFDTQGKE